MKNYLYLFLILCCGLVTQLFISCGGGNTAPKEEKATEASAPSDLVSDDALIKRGEYMVNAGACSDCHSPKKFTADGPVPNMDLWLSGHPADSKLPAAQPAALKAGWYLFAPDLTAFEGPWGTSFAANLTPDTATGIGTWTEATFFTAIRQGKFHGLPAGRNLLPPMPWAWFKNLTDEDLRSIFTYLKSIKPISNAVPAPIPPHGS